MKKFKYVLNVITVTLMLLTIAINRDANIFGKSVSDLLSDKEEEEIPIETRLEDGSLVINSYNLARDILGFGGNVPMIVTLKDDKITKVEIGENTESDSFLESILESNMLDLYKGLNASEVYNLKVDATSGATMTEYAIKENMRRVGAYLNQQAIIENDNPWLSWQTILKTIAGLSVISLGVFSAFGKLKGKRTRMVVQILNVLVLGIWCGSFISLSGLVSWLSNGVNLAASIVPLSLLVVSVALPLFDKKSTYCSFHCPMGSAQELLGQISKKKYPLSKKVTQRLTELREWIFVSLLFTMWIGVGFEIMEYEVFSIFLFGNASWIVIALGIVFLALSTVVNRPYCRFVCPTGALLKFSQQISK